MSSNEIIQSFSSNLFWDADTSMMSMDASPGYIIQRVLEDGLRLASPKDIAAMKVNAVMGHGTKKDFVDVYFLLQHYSFEELMQFYLQKYTDGSEYRALLSMSYFADADPQPMPYMFQQVDWNTIKIEILHQVQAYNNKHL